MNVKVLMILMIIVIGFVVSMFIPTTMEVDKEQTEKYEEPYTVQEAYVEKVPYTVKYQEAVYKTVNHNEPIYTTLYTIVLDDIGDGYAAIEINNILTYKTEYTGSDFWGNREYKVTLYDSSNKYYNTYYEINSVDVTESYDKITSYNVWSEKVIDKYVTKEKTEYKEETKYKDVVKTKTLERKITVTETIDCFMYEKIFG